MFPLRCIWDFACSCFRGGIQDTCLRCSGGKKGGLSPVGSTRRRPVLPRLALRRRPAMCRPAPTRPRYVRDLDSTGSVYIGFKTFAPPGGCPGRLSMPSGGRNEMSRPGRTVSPIPAPTRPVGPGRDLPGPVAGWGMFGFWIQQISSVYGSILA